MTLSLSQKKQFLFLLASLLGLTTPALGSPMVSPDIRTVSDSKIQQLEKLHQTAEGYILKNEFGLAIQTYNDILLNEPDDETAYTGLGQCYLVLGDLPRAKNAYLNALHINPDNETALLGIEKIQDPDKFNFTEEQAVQPPVRTGDGLPNPPTAIQSAPAQKVEAFYLGAKKTMAPYSVPLPEPIKNLSREQLIQVALKNAGFYRGPVDGLLGNATRKAVKDFQKKYDVAVDGRVGPKTWELLQPFINQNSFDENILKNNTSV